ncbi:MAG: 50S ribosomal protein L23 [Granulosicoccaceae bacterium]|jgi:large subunit ribosomal protein L23
MNQEKLMKVLLAPHISEKSTMSADVDNQVIFKVAEDASKLEIKKAVELLFKVEVDKVRTMNVRGKMKFLRNPGKRPNWKKAVVSLKPGQDIDFLGAE